MQTPSNQSFYRGSDRVIGGVCSGLAEGFHVDVLWVRLAFVMLAFLQGIGLLLYVVLWVVMPERTGYRPAGQTALETMGNDVKRAWADLRTQFGRPSPTTASAASATADAIPPARSPATSVSPEAVPASPSDPVPPQPASRNPSFILGAILIVVGVAFLAANTHLVDWSVIWPVTLVALGIALLVRNLQQRN